MGRAFQTEGGAGSGNKYVAFKEEQDGPCGWSKGVREKMVTGEARERDMATPVQGSVRHSKQFAYYFKSPGKELQDFRQGSDMRHAFQWQK